MTSVVQVAAAHAAIDQQNPWPGLGSFEEGSERFFNGRRNETAELRRLVLNAPLTVLFGASGLGKTSLVQAGLFPQLRKEHYLPIYVRLDLRDRDAPLIDQVKFALQTQLAARRVDAPALHGYELLWRYLHRAGLEFWSEQNQLLTPLFVFDQFEEVFTLGAENPTGIARLRIDLADLIENRVPSALADTAEEREAASEAVSLDSQRYKVVLSFREDFLPAVESWKRELPSILRNRLRLLPMSGEQAFEAVHITASHLVNESLARQIVRFVAAAQEEGGASGSAGMGELAVEPALLSLVCHGLNEKRKAQRKQAFDEALLSGTGQSIISDYYSRAVGDFPDRVQRFIENELITERGFRKPSDIDDARSVHGVTDRELRLLVDRRVLRIEPQRGTERVELTHDLLTRVVREHRDRQRERAKVRRQRRRMTLFGAVGLVLAALVALFGWLYVDASKLRVLAVEQAKQAKLAARQADLQTQRTRSALAEAKTQRAIADGQSKIASTAAHNAEAARRDAEFQASIATARQLATEALNRFEPSSDGLAISGALAVESLRAQFTPDGMKALAQVLRLIPWPPDILPQAHRGFVRSLAFSHDGHWMASEGERSVVLWDVSNGMKKSTLETQFPDAPVTAGLAFSYDGRSLAAGGMGLISIWATETGKLAQQLMKLGGFVRSVAFSPDGLHMAAAVRGVGAKLFERTSGQWQEIDSLFGGENIQSLIFSSNENLALAGSYAHPYQHGVWFRNLANKKEEFLETSNSRENFGECRILSISENSLVLAALCSNGILIADRSETGFRLADDPRARFDLFSVSYGISLNNTGKYVTALDNSGAVHVFGNPIQEEISLLPTSSALAFRPGGKTLATGLRDGSIALWPTSRRTDAIRLPYKGDVTGLAFTPGDRYLATAGADETVRVFDISDDTEIRQAQSFHIGPDLTDLTFSPDGRILLVLDKTALRIIGTKPWRRLPQYDQFGLFTAAGFTPDGRLVLAIGKDNIHRFDTSKWQQKMPAMAVPSLSGWKVSPDGRWLATTSNGSLTPASHNRFQRREVWNLSTGMATAWNETTSGGTPRAGVGPPQGGSQDLVSDSEKWRAGSENSLSPDGTLSFHLDGSTLTLQDANSARTVAKLEHDDDVIDAAFSPRRRWLATSSKDGLVRLWPLQAKDMIDQACNMLPRNLTPKEWSELHMNGPFHKTCESLP